MSLNIESTTKYSEADFDGSNAAPLLIVGPEQRRDLIARQDRLAENFIGASEQILGDVVDQEVVAFVGHSIRGRMHQREGQNSMMYSNRLYATPRFDLAPGSSKAEVLDACEMAKVGQASLAQQAIAACVYGMYGWEGKNATFIDTFRRELEEPMWDEVSDFAGVDARPRFEDMRGFKVHQFVGGSESADPIRAMRIEMKRTIHTLEDGTELKARTFAIINTADPRHFSQGALRSIYRAVRAGKDLSQHQPLLDTVERLVDDTLPAGVALARNETVYGYNADTEALFNEKRAKRAESDNKKFDKQFNSN